MDWQIPLLVSAIVFAAFLIFKMRPVVSSRGRGSAFLLRDAKAAISEAKDEPSRAAAHAAVGDAAALLGKFEEANAHYVRAFRLAPSAALVERARTSVGRRSRVTERLMWRFLAEGPWTGDRRDAAIAALRVLAALYDRRAASQPRAKAIENTLVSLGA